MSTSSRGMVQVLGATYRIVQTRSSYEVIRVLDDRVVGAFRHAGTLEVIRGESPELLLIAQEALRAARLAWSPPRVRRPSAGKLLARWRSVLRDAVFVWLNALVSAQRAIRTGSFSPFAVPGGLRHHR